MRTTFGVLAALGALLVHTPTALASSPTFDVTVSPAVSFVKPSGQASEKQITIRNAGDAPRTFYISIAEFQESADGTHINLIKPGPFSAASWVKFDKTEMTVPAHSSAFVNALIQVPPHAEPGERQVTVIFRSPSGGSKNIHLSGGVASNLVIGVPGKVVHNLRVDRLSIAHYHLHGVGTILIVAGAALLLLLILAASTLDTLARRNGDQLRLQPRGRILVSAIVAAGLLAVGTGVFFKEANFTGYGPVTSTLVLDNLGNVHQSYIHPNELQLVTASGKVPLPNFTVLAHSKRQIQTVWGNPPFLCLPCRLTVKVPTPQGTTVAAHAHVIVLPWVYLLGALLTFSGLAYLIRSSFKGANRRRQAKVEALVAERLQQSQLGD